ncbi:MAG: hypothetical protein O7C59_02045 [Rickettsia endosymbiont of Ixodes persulcatus]|nr:hypothetical protein [Rickettsia endosymbiont of Ixodes persulcatus]
MLIVVVVVILFSVVLMRYLVSVVVEVVFSEVGGIWLGIIVASVGVRLFRFACVMVKDAICVGSDEVRLMLVSFVVLMTVPLRIQGVCCLNVLWVWFDSVFVIIVLIIVMMVLIVVIMV